MWEATHAHVRSEGDRPRAVSERPSRERASNSSSTVVSWVGVTRPHWWESFESLSPPCTCTTKDDTKTHGVSTVTSVTRAVTVQRGVTVLTVLTVLYSDRTARCDSADSADSAAQCAVQHCTVLYSTVQQ